VIGSLEVAGHFALESATFLFGFVLDFSDVI
jgi:hypothetical protein